MLSEVDNPETQVDCEISHDDDDVYDPEEENLSDTDPEDEEDWGETVAV